MPKQAVNPDGQSCAYRTLDGCKCIIGSLIPDDDYDPNMEGSVISLDPESVSPLVTILRRVIVLTTPVERLGATYMMRAFQKLHDPASSWDDTGFRRWGDVKMIALSEGLTFTDPRVPA